MGKTELIRGFDSSKLPDRKRRFCYEYVTDYNGTEAAIRAGYSKKTATSMANKLLRDTPVKALIRKLEAEMIERTELERQEIIEQLAFCVTRKVSDFVDDEGYLKPISELSQRAEACIDGFDQTVTEYHDRDGNPTHKTVKTKVRLVPKAQAIEMAMKYRGLFAPEKHDHQVRAAGKQEDWDELYDETELPDPIEERIENE